MDRNPSFRRHIPSAALAGIEVDEWTTLAAGETRRAAFTDGSSLEIVAYSESPRMIDESTQPLAQRTDGDAAGTAIASLA